MVVDQLKRTEPPEVRRSQILEAAKRRFREVGFHATKMAEVAELAGVSVGLIYRHFPSKEALIEGIALEDLERQLQQFTAVLDAHPDDILAAFGAAAEAAAPMVADRERTVLMLEIAAEAARNPKIRCFASETQLRIRQLYRNRIAVLKPDAVSVDELEVRFQLLAAIIQGVAIQLATRDDEPSPLLLPMLARTAKALMVFDGAE